MYVDCICPVLMKSILLTTIEHFIMRLTPFRYTNHVEIVPKISLIFRKIPKKFLKFCKNTPKIIPKISLIAARHPAIGKIFKRFFCKSCRCLLLQFYLNVQCYDFVSRVSS